MKVAVYPGSFDPVTNGHLDIIDRSSKLFDQLYVVIMQNPNKHNIYSLDERVEMLKLVTKDYRNVGVMAQNGLTVNVAKDLNASFLIRGIRAFSDFDYEYQIALTNQDLSENIETVFLIARPEFIFVSSSTVKEIAHFKKDVSKYVTKIVKDAIEEKFKWVF